LNSPFYLKRRIGTALSHDLLPNLPNKYPGMLHPGIIRLARGGMACSPILPGTVILAFQQLIDDIPAQFHYQIQNPFP
jgi:hypothetical protein